MFQGYEYSRNYSYSCQRLIIRMLSDSIIWKSDKSCAFRVLRLGNRLSAIHYVNAWVCENQFAHMAVDHTLPALKPVGFESYPLNRFKTHLMKLNSKISPILAAIALGSGAEAASVIGVINFSSGPGGGVILQDSAGNATTDLTAATGVKEWLLPEVDATSGSFISVPDGQSVSMSQPWVFAPSTPMTPLWTIAGFGDFTFNVSSTTITLQDNIFLQISATGTLTGTNFDATPATWLFTTQGGPSDGKFSWSSETAAVPETSSPALLGAALLGACFMRRRKLT